MTRQATIEDLDEVAIVFDAYRVWYRKDCDIDGAKEFIKNRIVNGESIIFLAEDENQVVGFTQLYPIFSSTRMKPMWLLNDLYIVESKRGQGLGRNLIQAAKNHCVKTSACGILLETETSNKIGNRLYQKEKFHLEENNFYFWTNV